MAHNHKVTGSKPVIAKKGARNKSRLAQLVERGSNKPKVNGSSPLSRIGEYGYKAVWRSGSVFGS